MQAGPVTGSCYALTDLALHPGIHKKEETATLGGRRCHRAGFIQKLAAGICGILIGQLGVHKFILGMTTPGLIMLLVTLGTCGVGGIVMIPIGIIEGVMYLTKSDEEFYQTYVVGRKEWF